MHKVALYLFLIFTILYQTFATYFGFRYSDLYTLINPYSLSIILLFILSIYFIYYEGIIIYNAIIPIFIIYFLFLYNTPIYINHQLVIMSILKNIQFIWGCLILIPAYIYMARFFSSRGFILNYYSLVAILLVLFSSINILEFVLTNFFDVPLDNIPYLMNMAEVDDYSRLQAHQEYKRPIGLIMYPQPNGFITSYLLFLFTNKYKYTKVVSWLGLLGLILTFSGTGILFYILATSINLKGIIKFKYLIYLFLFVIVFFTYVPNYFYKFSFFYFNYLFDLLISDYYIATSGYDLSNYLFGSNNPRISFNGTGINHDFAYLGIFEEQGLFGLTFYLIIIYNILFKCLPFIMQKKDKIQTTILLILINFHYPLYSFVTIQVIIATFIFINYLNKLNLEKSTFNKYSIDYIT